MIKRLVGYYEYGNCLLNLNALLATISDLEFEQLDAYVRKRPEYSVMTNLASELPQGPSTLASPKSGPVRRKGLDWMLALARLELGTMLAGFSPTVCPYEAVGVSDYDINAYKALLLDGVRTHYWALLRDPDLGGVLNAKDITRVLSYSRRLVMVRAMLRAVIKSSREDFSPTQMQELYSWKESLDNLQGQFTIVIRNYLQDSAQASQSQREYQTLEVISPFCYSILRAEQRELAAGRAKIYPTGP